MGTLEKPRDIYLSACRALASELESQGFRYAASRQVATRKGKCFDHVVAFQSSHRNAPGAYVALLIHAHVRSKGLGAWRASHPMPWSAGVTGPNDVVAGGQIGNLQAKPEWLDWNFAHAASRERALADASAAMGRFAGPLFAVFNAPAEAVARLRLGGIPGLEPLNALEFLLCFADREAAQGYLGRFFAARPDLAADYTAALATFRREGLPRARNNFARDLAAATLAYGLST